MAAMNNPHWMNRRAFLAASAGALVAQSSPPLRGGSATESRATLGKAEHCIFIWLGGGMGQIRYV